MYFVNYGFRKTLLDKCLKSRVLEDPSTSKWEKGSSSAQIWMAPLLPYLLITVKAIKFEKVSLSDRQDLRTVF